MARILLIEPDQLLAAQYREYLSSLGYQIAWCKNAQDAVNQADKHRPDLIVLELLLAAHSGIEFLYELRSYAEWRRIPVVILSRMPRADLPVTDEVLSSLGVSAYLYKPETSLKRLGARLSALCPVPKQPDTASPQ